MTMTWTVFSILMLGAAAGIASIGLLVAVVFCPARRLAREARVGVPGECPCCGYATEGLEEPLCPECGRGFGEAWARTVRRRRIGMGVGGLGLGLASIGIMMAADAARFGAAHAAPTMALVGALRLVPEWHGAIVRELQGRVDAEQLGGWTSSILARACAAVVRDERDSAARRDAAWLLVRVAPFADRESLRAMVDDRDDAVRSHGVEALRMAGRDRVGEGSVADRLNSLAIDDASAIVRKRAIDAMRYRGDDGAASRSTMLLALEDPNDGVRQRALLAVAESRVGTADAVRAVGAKTKDESSDVRQMAALTLGRMAARRPDAADALAESLRDESPMVRACAVMALAEAGRGGGGPAWMWPRLLSAALGDEDEVVRDMAMDAIRGMRG
jgi:hypothetical protein